MKINWKDDETVRVIAIADIGNYIRLKLAPRTDGVYVLYLHIRKWKEDGCKENKLCQAQEVASFKTDDMKIAKDLSEKWFSNFARDMIGFAGFSLTDLVQ